MIRHAIWLPAISALFWTFAELVMLSQGSAPTYGSNLTSIGLLLLWAAVGSLLDNRKT